MNQTLKLLHHIEFFNQWGILEIQFKTASDEDIKTIEELCNFFDDEVTCMIEESE